MFVKLFIMNSLVKFSQLCQNRFYYLELVSIDSKISRKNGAFTVNFCFDSIQLKCAF